jgi:hypothetical protein
MVQAMISRLNSVPTATFNDLRLLWEHRPSGVGFSFNLDPGVVKTAGAHFLAIVGTGTVHDLTHVLSDTPGIFMLTTPTNPPVEC